MDLSLVIVSFNTREILDECLKSVRIAIKNLQAEVFIVDNNSSDGTVQTVRENHPWVKLITNKQNLGFSKANNLALKKAKGYYILVLNPDTKLMPDTITKMIDFLKKHQDVAVATCRVELANGALDRDCRRHFPSPWRAFCHFTGLSKIFPGSKIFDQYYMGYLPSNIEHEVDACAGAFMLICKSAMDKVGLFDEDFFFYGEDLDWCWRFREAGYKIIYTPITKIIHYKGVSSGIKKETTEISKATRESKKRALKESTRAMKLFYEKHYKDKYPFFINWLMFLGIWVLERIRLEKFKISAKISYRSVKINNS